MRSLHRISPASLLLTLPLLAAPLLLASSAVAMPPLRTAPAQDDEDEKPDKRPEIKELCDQLKGHIKKKGKEDDQAREVIDRLYQEFPECGPKDRKAIVGVLEDCFKQKRKKDKDKGEFDNALFMTAAVAMKDMAPESVKPLIKLIDHKNHDDDLALQRRIILSVGATKHEDGIKPLTKLLNHHLAVMQAAAGEALGEYEVLEQEERKEVFSELLKTVMRVRANVDTDPEDLIARDRYEVIAAPIITSLQRLSGHDERDPHKWQSWWNNNKKKNWDEDL